MPQLEFGPTFAGIELSVVPKWACVSFYDVWTIYPDLRFKISVLFRKWSKSDLVEAGSHPWNGGKWSFFATFFNAQQFADQHISSTKFLSTFFLKSLVWNGSSKKFQSIFKNEFRYWNLHSKKLITKKSVFFGQVRICVHCVRG